MEWRLVALAGSMLLFAGGCHSRPHAPELVDEPVYESRQEGFRFSRPPGWTQYARAELPGGRLEKERLLVEYQRLGGDKPASLLVTAIDLPADKPIEQYLPTSRHGSRGWRQIGKSESIEINGVKAMRAVFAGEGRTRELAVFSRGDRHYLFAGVFQAGDASAREQIRAAVGSVQWDKHR